MPRVWFVVSLITLACGGPEFGPAAPRAESPNGPSKPSAVPIIYDENGQPNLTYFSAAVTNTISGAIPTLNRPDLYGSHNFTETFSWQAGQDWDVSLSFPTNASPFSGAPAPLYDVSLARLNAVTRVADFRLRSGGQLPLPPPSVTVYVPGGTSAQWPAPPAMPAAGPAAPAGIPTAADRRSGLTQARVVSPAGAARTLAQLRSRFAETRQGRLSVFRRTTGEYAADISYDHDQGLIVASAAFLKGRKAFATSFVYADSLGLKLLRSETTTYYDRNGREMHRTSRAYSDVKLVFNGGR